VFGSFEEGAGGARAKAAEAWPVELLISPTALAPGSKASERRNSWSAFLATPGETQRLALGPQARPVTKLTAAYAATAFHHRHRQHPTGRPQPQERSRRNQQ
jgi:hypothetical protein